MPWWKHLLENYALAAVEAPIVVFVLYGSARLVSAALVFFIPPGRFRDFMLARSAEDKHLPPTLVDRSSYVAVEKWLLYRLEARNDLKPWQAMLLDRLNARDQRRFDAALARAQNQARAGKAGRPPWSA